MKPMLWNIDRDREPPMMVICLPGLPRRFVSIELETPGTTRHEIVAAALREFKATDPAVLEVIAAGVE